MLEGSEQENKTKEKGDTAMTKTELNKYKQILEAKLAELSQAVREREGIAIEKTPDAIDEVQHAAERELAIRNLDRETQLLRNVRATLQRIADGSFGICLRCDEEISPKRLNAVPWTPYCISCQEYMDKRRAEEGESIEELLVA